MRHFIGPEHPPARLLVAGDLGDVGAERLARGAIDLHHLERGSDPTGAETGDDTIVPVAKAHHLVFRPEPGRRWWREWNRLAQQMDSVRVAEG